MNGFRFTRPGLLVRFVRFVARWWFNCWIEPLESRQKRRPKKGIKYDP